MKRKLESRGTEPIATPHPVPKEPFSVTPLEQYRAIKQAVEVHLIAVLAAMVADYARDGLTEIAERRVSYGPEESTPEDPWVNSIWNVSIDLDRVVLSVKTTVQLQERPPYEEAVKRWRKTDHVGFREGFESDAFKIFRDRDHFISAVCKLQPRVEQRFIPISMPLCSRLAFLQHLRDLSS